MAEWILLVDDDPSSLGLLKTVLENLAQFSGVSTKPITIVAANSGAEAMQKISDATELPALVITDLMMEGMNGIDLIGALEMRLGHGHQVKIALATAFSDENVINLAKTSGWLFIGKPFNFLEVCKAVIKFCPALRLEE